MYSENYYYHHQELIRHYEDVLCVMADMYPPLTKGERRDFEDMQLIALDLLEKIKQLEVRFYGNGCN